MLELSEKQRAVSADKVADMANIAARGTHIKGGGRAHKRSQDSVFFSAGSAGSASIVVLSISPLISSGLTPARAER
jgi:hypothetical protein